MHESARRRQCCIPLANLFAVFPAISSAIYRICTIRIVNDLLPEARGTPEKNRAWLFIGYCGDCPPPARAGWGLQEEPCGVETGMLPPPRRPLPLWRCLHDSLHGDTPEKKGSLWSNPAPPSSGQRVKSGPDLNRVVLRCSYAGAGREERGITPLPHPPRHPGS